MCNICCHFQVSLNLTTIWHVSVFKHMSCIRGFLQVCRGTLAVHERTHMSNLLLFLQVSPGLVTIWHVCDFKYVYAKSFQPYAVAHWYAIKDSQMPNLMLFYQISPLFSDNMAHMCFGL